MGVQAPPELLGIHTNMPGIFPADIDQAAFSGAPAPSGLSADEKLAYERLQFVYQKGIAYGFQMGLRPQTLYGIADSPVGLAAYFLDHDARSYELISRVFEGETEGLTRDDILDNITITWLTNTALSGARLYWEYWGKGYFNAKGVSIPVAVSVFPDELYPAPRSWTEQAYPKLIHYNRLPKGGHFAAWEQPQAFFRRGSRGLQIAAVRFFTREEKMMTQSSATQRGSEQARAQFNTDRTHPGRWTITFSNPPINMFVPATIVELGALMTDIEADPSVKVVVFQSANPDFFIAHLDVAKAAERPEVLGLWRDFVLRLSSTPVVSIAKIRGRTRGIGNEFVLACDMRFASRKSAVFGNPEVGVGLVPGGGALEWLPRLVGRSRALEIVLSGDDFDADIAERYGWVNRALDDDDLDSFVDALARRLASFDRETLAAAKAQINRFGTPTAAELQSSNDLFFPLLALPGAQARRAKIRNIGYGVPSDFELNFGRYLPAFGPADDDTDTQPD